MAQTQRALGTVCASTTLDANPASPQPVGTAVTLTAASDCDTPEFQFEVYNNSTGNWDIVQAFSSNSVFNWDTTGLQPGDHPVEVQARNAGNIDPDSYASIHYELTVASGATCSDVSLGASPPSPQGVGTQVTFTASSPCTGGGTSEFRFWFFDGTAWAIVQDWSTTDTYGLDTGSLAPADYAVEVENRIQGATDPQSAAVVHYTVTVASTALCQNVVLSTNPASPAGIGSIVRLSGNVTCTGGGMPEFRFWIWTPNTDWQVVQDWSAMAFYDWATASLPAGTYAIQVDTRVQGLGHTDPDSYQGAHYDLTVANNATCGADGAATLTSNVASPQPAGTIVTFTAGAGCTGGGSPEFRYWVFFPATGWAVVRDWSTVATYDWNTTGLSPDEYVIQAEAGVAGRHSGDGYAAVRYDVTAGAPGRCATVVLNASPSSPQAAGTPVQLSGAATCTGGAAAEYQFQVWTPETDWQIVQAFSATSTYNWDTSGLAPGTYAVTVEARAQGASGTESYDSAHYDLQ